MKVILLETMENLGSIGEVVNVRAGYARNFLVPNAKAVAASERNLKQAAHQKIVTEHRIKRARKAAEEVRGTIEGKKIVIKRKAGESGKLFGSVTTQDIAEALGALGVTLSRKFVHLEEPIKKTGSYKVRVRLEGGLDAHARVEVAAEEG